jgi:hypothetical protein
MTDPTMAELLKQQRNLEQECAFLKQFPERTEEIVIRNERLFGHKSQRYKKP